MEKTGGFRKEARTWEGLQGKTSDPEVPEKPVRRRFTAEYKRRIVEEADRCTQPGELGALLSREGFYSSHLTTWRRHREAGMLRGCAYYSERRRAAGGHGVHVEVVFEPPGSEHVNAPPEAGGGRGGPVFSSGVPRHDRQQRSRHLARRHPRHKRAPGRPNHGECRD